MDPDETIDTSDIQVREAWEWVGACIRDGQTGQPAPIPSGMTFQLFHASHDPYEFLVNDANAPATPLPPCPAGRWKKWRTLFEAGEKRVGFSEAEARMNITESGFYRFRYDPPADYRTAAE